MTEIDATLSAPNHPTSQSGDPGDSGARPEYVSGYDHIIRPSSGWRAINWGEMFEYRELLVFLIWRDFAARYKQTILGGAWALIQPIVTLVIFSLIAYMARIPMPMDLPAPVCIFAGLIPWAVFSQAMPAAASSLISSLNMVTKVYFPRLFLPISAASIFLVDGVLTLFVYAGLLVFYQIPPHWTVIFLPFLFALTMIAALGIGITLAGLTLFYRDFKHVVPFLVQIMMYMTPIFYTINPTVPAKLRWILSLNPMFGITDAFRASILGIPIEWDCLLISGTVALGLFVFSLFYFRRSERMFADYV